jgi:D-alanine transaminase
VREYVYLNGSYVAKADAVVPVDDRGYQFADGVYEVVKYYGRRPLRLDLHLERLEESCAGLRIIGAPAAAEWVQILDALVECTDLPDDPGQCFTLYQQVTRGVAPRNHLFPSGVKPGCVAYFMKCPVYAPELRERGIALSSQPDERWNHCDLKTIMLLPSIMAKQAARDAGAFEALLVRSGVVTEGSSTNVFCVREGIVYTHPGGGAILSGVTRALTLMAAERAGLQVREEPVTHSQFAAADEAFLTSTTMNVMPATVLDGKPIGSGEVGPITCRIASAVDDLINQEIGLEPLLETGS